MTKQMQMFVMLGLGGVVAWLCYRNYQTKKAAEEAVEESMRETDAVIDQTQLANGGPTLQQVTFGVAGRIPERGEFYLSGVGGI